MTDELEVDNLLEAAFEQPKLGSSNGERSSQSKSNKESDRHRDHRQRGSGRDGDSDKRRYHSRSRSRSRSRDRHRHKRSRSRERDKDRNRDRERRRDREPEKEKEKVKEKDREKDREKDKEKDRERDKERDRERGSSASAAGSDPRNERWGGGGWGYSAGLRSDVVAEPVPQAPADMIFGLGPEPSPETRDARTVLVMQLAQRVGPGELKEFFSKVGKVLDVRMIVDNKTRRSKGVAYVEFHDIDSVQLATALSGTRLCGIPILVQASQAEKNRVAQAPAQALMAAASTAGVGLPGVAGKTATELLASAISIANALGSAAAMPLLAPGTTSPGPLRIVVGNVHPLVSENDLREVLEPFGKLDDLQLVRGVEHTGQASLAYVTFRRGDEGARVLAHLEDLELAGRRLKVVSESDRVQAASQGRSLDLDDFERRDLAPIKTPCFMLSNVFDIRQQTRPGWADDLKALITSEVQKYGELLHVHVDAISPQGSVFVRCISAQVALNAVRGLNTRSLAGRPVTAAFVPLVNYMQLFPNAY